MIDYENYPIIAAVRGEEDFRAALQADVETVFLLSTRLIDLEGQIQKARLANKKLFVHLDFIEGLSRDAAGVEYLSTKGVDGVISTRSNIINAAKEHGLCCVQRFFMVDSRSVDTALETIRQTKADLVEIMPGIAYKAISRMCQSVSVPIIAGGLIEEKEEIYHALAAGACVVSTGKRSLWVL